MKLTLPQSDTQDWNGLPAEEFELAERAVALCTYYRRVLDVHAHVGVRALMFAPRFLSVEAFEPQEECYHCFNVNVQSPRVNLRRIGIHGTTGVGYTPVHAGKDSAAARLSLQQIKNTVKVPIARIDDYGWSDVDLIFLSRSTSWLDVLNGATETIQKSRPVICVTLKDRSERVSMIITRLAGLLDIGYRIVEIDDDRLILSAQPATGAVDRPLTATLLSSEALGDRHIIAGPIDIATTPGGGSQSVIGRIIAPTRAASLGSSGGPAHFYDFTVSQAVDATAPLSVILPDGTTIDLSAPVPLDMSSLSDQIEIGLDASGGTVALPLEIAALATEILVNLPSMGRPIFRKRMSQLRQFDAIGFRWPLDAIGAKRLEIQVQLRRDDVVIAEKNAGIDLTLHHLHPDTVTCYLNRGGGGIAAINALAESLGCRSAYAEDGYKSGVSVVWGRAARKQGDHR